MEWQMVRTKMFDEVICAGWGKPQWTQWGWQKPYSCRRCSDCFRTLYQLKRHLLKSHNKGTWFTCDICQQQFITSGGLKQHSLRLHEDVKPYVCSECPKSFCTSRELRLHRLVLKWPLNKGQISHFGTNRSLIYDFLQAVNSNFCSRTHRLATIHRQTDI